METKTKKLNKKEIFALNAFKAMTHKDQVDDDFDFYAELEKHLASFGYDDVITLETGGQCLVIVASTSEDRLVSINDECFVVYKKKPNQDVGEAFYDSSENYEETELFVSWRCKDCQWIHEADSEKGTSFQGVSLCDKHKNAVNNIERLERDNEAMLEALKVAEATLKELDPSRDYDWARADIEKAIKQAEGGEVKA